MAQCHKRAFVNHPARAIHPHEPLRSSAKAGPKTALLRCHRRSRRAGKCQRSYAYTVNLAPPLAGLTCGRQVIEGLHRAGVEFRSLSEDFDTATPTGKLQLAMVLAFSEWWWNSNSDGLWLSSSKLPLL